MYVSTYGNRSEGINSGQFRNIFPEHNLPEPKTTLNPNVVIYIYVYDFCHIIALVFVN